jgi:hypothetical protein
MPKCAFEYPLRKFRSEANWLRLEFARSANGPRTALSSQLVCEMVVVRLHDSWTRFCRELIVLSAYGNTTTLSGNPISKSNPLITDRASIIPLLMSSLYRKPQRNEPRWGTARECIDAATRLGIQNLSTVAAAIGAANSPADQLRIVRNFYAHRKKETAINAIGTGHFSHPFHPIVFHLNALASAGMTIMDTWIQGLEAVATAAIQ